MHSSPPDDRFFFGGGCRNKRARVCPPWPPAPKQDWQPCSTEKRERGGNRTVPTGQIAAAPARGLGMQVKRGTVATLPHPGWGYPAMQTMGEKPNWPYSRAPAAECPGRTLGADVASVAGGSAISCVTPCHPPNSDYSPAYPFPPAPACPTSHPHPWPLKATIDPRALPCTLPVPLPQSLKNQLKICSHLRSRIHQTQGKSVNSELKGGQCTETYE